MGSVVIRYRVKPERVEENERLVEAVYAELAERRPAGFEYATHRLADGVTFVHVATITAEGNPLAGIAAFAEFTRDIEARCDEPPQPSASELIGSYRSTE